MRSAVGPPPPGATQGLGVTDNRVGDAAHQRPPYPAQSSATHDDEACFYILGNSDDLLGPVSFGHPQVLLSNFPPDLLDLLCLIFENVFGSPAEAFDDVGDTNIVSRIAGRDGHHVQLRVGGVG